MQEEEEEEEACTGPAQGVPSAVNKAVQAPGTILLVLAACLKAKNQESGPFHSLLVMRTAHVKP